MLEQKFSPRFPHLFILEAPEAHVALARSFYFNFKITQILVVFFFFSNYNLTSCLCIVHHSILMADVASMVEAILVDRETEKDIRFCE